MTDYGISACKSLLYTVLALGPMGVLPGSSLAGEIGFPERFALAPDREEALAQLIPGTEEYYFYHCLHFQNSGRLDEVDSLLETWIDRHGRTGRVLEIENRQALYRFDTTPRESLDFLEERLGIHLDHQRETLGEKPRLPTRLDPARIRWEACAELALDRHKGTLDGFEDRALDQAMELDLDPDRRRNLLSRLRRPDLPGLPQRIVDDLHHEKSRGFGSLGIHHLLLREQLDECLRLDPTLLNQTTFIQAYLPKLWPTADVDWRNEPSEREAYLERLQRFVVRLQPAHNSLKAQVLYHRLVHDRSRGVYDRSRFLEYIRLPRKASWVNPEYLEQEDLQGQLVNPDADFRSITLLPPVGNDEPLIRSILSHFFLEADDFKPFEKYIHDTWLKHLFAETKILAGRGDMETWYSMLPPEKYQALKDRVDLDFAPTNKEVFGADEPVALDLHVKNVESLIVKVFEINTFNVYRENLRELDTSVDLDGLVANEERSYSYDEPALRRVKRHFEFPSLARRGTFVVEFIGGGRSSRALIRKGGLRHLVRTGMAGHVFTVLDERNQTLQDATLWLAGQMYYPDEEGRITVPFSSEPGRQPIILVAGDSATLESFEHQSESYRLAAGIHVEREELLAGGRATVIIRPTLAVNGVPVLLSILEEPTLVITSKDQDGVETVQEIQSFELSEDRESTHEFQVPPRLSSIRFELKARVRNLSRGSKEDLGVSRTFTLNGIDATGNIEDLHLMHAGGEYTIEVLGKTGETRSDRPVHVTLKHRDFRDVVEVVLKSDETGQVSLGALDGIEWVRARGPEGTQHTWNTTGDRHTYPGSLHGRAGEALLVPRMGSGTEPRRSEVSLLERRGGTFVRDRFDALSIESGYLRIQGLPPGDYDLRLEGPGRDILIRITEGEERAGYVLSGYRQLERRNPKPLQIASMVIEEEAVRIRLEGSSSRSRVHVIATRYLPEYPPWENLVAFSILEPHVIIRPGATSQYVTGRDLGDEYRYILERRQGKIYPGNMLTRPGLLLNPWAIRATETGLQVAREGESYELSEPVAISALARRGRAEGEKKDAGDAGGFSSLDFLAEGSTVLLNLVPDEKGELVLDREMLGSHHQLHVLAVSPDSSAYREVTLEEMPRRVRDLRLLDSLDPQKHFTEQKEVRFVDTGEAFVLPDITTSEAETYDTLGKAYRLLATLSGDATLVEFGFILDWPGMTPEEKRERYTKYASHELHFFLFHKDPEFFQEVVKPYLANKHPKTFLDRWLLGEDLEEYLKPWEFARLNIVERILLARRIAAERPAMTRHVQDLLDLIPPEVARLDHIFRTGLRGRALEAEGEGQALREAKTAELERRFGRTRKLADLESLNAIVLDSPARPPASSPDTTRAPAKPGADAIRNGREATVEDFALAGIAADDLRRRGEVRQLYRKLEKTREWVENHYYHLPIEKQDASLVTVNPFWNDFARHEGKSPFFSTHFAEASRSFTETMLALSVLDLPFEAAGHETEVEEATFELRPGSPLIVFHKQIREAEPSEEKVPILVTQNFYRFGDRYVQVGNERRDNFITDEFLVHVVYGCQVVITNPTSASQKLDVLLQIPRGAIPVKGGQRTRSLRVQLEPYRTWTTDYFFYFPAPAESRHFPVHVARNEKLVASAEPVMLHVVRTPSTVDEASWDYISQHGTEDQVLAHLQANNLGRIRLDRIAWRMRDKAFFEKVIGLLESRYAYDPVLWSYGFAHNSTDVVREYLKHSDSFLRQCGAAIDCSLLVLDPVERRTYQHREYWPLVNARAHRLGKTRQILNDRFHEQYLQLMHILSYRPELDDEDLLSVTCYLLLQDRVEDAIGMFEQVRPGRLAASLQYDYLDAYLGLYTENLRRSRTVAGKYAAHPVDRWRNLFAGVLAQLDEIEGKAARVVDEEDRTQIQTGLASTEPSFDLSIDGGEVTIHYQNLEECRIHYYLMDIELLFSRNPFVGQYSGQFAYIRPNFTEEVELPKGTTKHVFPLPEKLLPKNVLVEVLGAGEKKAVTHLSGAMSVQLIESYAQAKVTHAESGKTLSAVYVKAYARMKDGGVRFYKDGYTDLRGRFDYGSLSTNELDHVDRFALLFLSDEHGAVVREAAPPQR